MVNFQDPTLLTYLHSQSNPKKEAERFLASLLPTADVQIIIGSGALHSLEALVEKGNFPKVLVFWEPIAEIYQCQEWQTKKQHLVSRISNLGFQVFFIETSEGAYLQKELKLIFHVLEGRLTYSVSTFPSYQRKFGDSLAIDCKQQIESVLQLSNDATKMHFERTWTHHYLQNLSANNCQLLHEMRLDSNSLLFIGASPQLEIEVENIKKNRNQFFIIAGDTSFPFLVSQNVNPDMILSMDTGRGTIFHFCKRFPNDIPILTWFGAHPILFQLPNPKWILRTTHPMDQVLNHALEKNQTKHWTEFKNPGLNQATLAKEIAIQSKVPNFIYSGVSFLQMDGKSHCRGTGYEFYYSPIIDRKRTLENLYRPLYREKRAGKNSIAWDWLNKANTETQTFAFSDWLKESGEGTKRELDKKVPGFFGKEWNPVFLEKMDWSPLFAEPSAGVSLPALRRFLRGTKSNSLSD